MFKQDSQKKKITNTTTQWNWSLVWCDRLIVLVYKKNIGITCAIFQESGQVLNDSDLLFSRHKGFEIVSLQDLITILWLILSRHTALLTGITDKNVKKKKNQQKNKQTKNHQTKSL